MRVIGVNQTKVPLIYFTGHLEQVWSLMYHSLAKKGEEPLMVAKGKDSGASFDFTAVDAFNLLSPDND